MNFDEIDIAIPEEVTEERKPYFDALRVLREGDFKEAHKSFKRASRVAEAPFDVLALIAAGECEYRLGRQGAALKTWRKVATDDALADALRYTAWLNIASLEEARDNRRGLDEANAALQDFGDAFVS